MSPIVPKGQRQFIIEIVSLVGIIIVVYGYLIISSPTDASAVILAALGIIGGQRAAGSINSTYQHKYSNANNKDIAEKQPTQVEK